MLDRAVAAELEEQAALERREIAGTKQQEEHQAERLFKATHRAGQGRLEKLRDVSAPLLSKMEKLEADEAACKAKLQELTAEETRLGELAERRPTEEELGGEIRMENERIVVMRRSMDEEISARMLAHHECLAQLSQIKDALRHTEKSIKVTRIPLERIKAEAVTIRKTVSAAQEKLKSVKNQARAAAMSGQRRTDFAHRSAAELDAQIGQAVLDEVEVHSALDLLIKGTTTCKRRAQTVEAELESQNDQLALYDAETAKSGTYLLVGGTILALVLALTGLSVITRVLSG